MIAYHGTSYKIEYFDLDHLGDGEGQSVFAGIYFTTDKYNALSYAKLSSEKTGEPPRVYAVELELKNPLYASNGLRFFTTRSAFISFIKDYFPSWFDKNGDLLSIHRDYVNEKFATYQGQYNLIKFAAKENGLKIVELEEELGYDSCIDGTDIAITNPNSILSFEEIYGPDAESSFEETATEALADRYLVDSRHGADYKTMPGNRYKRRMRIRTEGGARVWYDIDVNRFFNKDEFTLHIPVIGETDEYTVEIQLKNWLPILRNDIKTDGFSVIAFRKSLTKGMRNLDVKINCNCCDFLYAGFAYYLTKSNDNSGTPELRPPKIKNPNNDKGKACKHCLFCLSNRIWISRIARILFNYCFNLYKQNKPLFDRTIAKKLDITDEMVEGRPIERRKPVSKPVENVPKETENKNELNKQLVDSYKTEEKLAGESYYSDYYRTAKDYDDDQLYMISVARDAGVDVENFITPQNSPEQISEVTSDILRHLDDNVIRILSNPDLSTREHQIIREAYSAGINLIPYIGFDPDVLKQIFLGIKQGIDPKLLAVKGRNHRQIEQLRTAYKLDKDLFNELSSQNLNYEQLKDKIKQWRLAHENN